MTPLHELRKKLEVKLFRYEFNTKREDVIKDVISEIDLLLEKEKETIIEAYDKSFHDQMDGILMEGKDYFSSKFE